MPDDEGRRALQAGGLEQRRPVEARRLRRRASSRVHTCGSAARRPTATRVAWTLAMPRLEVDDRARRAAPASATPIRPSTVATCARVGLAQRRHLRAASTRSSRDPAGPGRPAAGTACCGPGSCSPCATHTPNRCSVWKLVAFSGSTSARIVPPIARASARRSAMAAIASSAGFSGVSPLASIPASSMNAGVEVGRPCGPRRWHPARPCRRPGSARRVCWRVWSMRMLDAP